MEGRNLLNAGIELLYVHLGQDFGIDAVVAHVQDQIPFRRMYIAISHQFRIFIVESDARLPHQSAVKGVCADAVHVRKPILLIDAKVGEGQIIGIIMGIFV